MIGIIASFCAIIGAGVIVTFVIGLVAWGFEHLSSRRCMRSRPVFYAPASPHNSHNLSDNHSHRSGIGGGDIVHDGRSDNSFQERNNADQ